MGQTAYRVPSYELRNSYSTVIRKRRLRTYAAEAERTPSLGSKEIDTNSRRLLRILVDFVSDSVSSLEVGH